MRKLNFKYYNNDKGATSVLVILMMIVLVTLGAFAILSANSNIKLARSAINWNKTYFSLNEKGEEFLKDIDLTLYMAEEEALSAVMEESVLSTPKQLNEKLNKYYMGISNEKMANLSNEYSSSQIFPFVESDIIKQIAIENDFSDPVNLNMHLMVSVAISPLQYNFKVENNKIDAQDNTDASRFIIKDWYEWQKPNEFDEKQELWDGVSN